MTILLLSYFHNEHWYIGNATGNLQISINENMVFILQQGPQFIGSDRQSLLITPAPANNMQTALTSQGVHDKLSLQGGRDGLLKSLKIRRLQNQ